jgi:hypothetical protein
MTVTVNSASSSRSLNFLGHVFIRETPQRQTSGIRGAYSDQASVVGDNLDGNTVLELDVWTENLADMESLINFLPSVTKIVAVDNGATYERQLGETGAIWRSSPIDHGYRKKRFTLRAVALYSYWTKVGSSGTKHYL